MSGTIYICNPGSTMITPGTEHEVCRCRHERLDHWFGGGDCGFMFGTGSTCRCQYFKAPKVKP